MEIGVLLRLEEEEGVQGIGFGRKEGKGSDRGVEDAGEEGKRAPERTEIVKPKSKREREIVREREL